MQLQNHPLHLLLEALHHVYKDGFYMMRSGRNFGSCRSDCILRASMHLQITDLTFTLDEEEVEKVCPLRPCTSMCTVSTNKNLPSAHIAFA